jgi:hypothetical protein
MHDALLNLLRDPQPVLPETPRAWSDRIAEARTSGLLPALAHRVDGLPQPAQAKAHLQACLHLQTLRLQYMQREIRHLADALEPLGVPWVLLKGGAYVAMALPFAIHRQFGDIDLLVARQDLRRVESALMGAGWIGERSQDAHDERFYREWSHEVPPVTHVRRGSTVDLHHAIAPPLGRYPVSTDALLAASQVVPGYQHLRTLQPLDMVLHSALHSVVSGEFDRSLRDLLDIDALIQHHAASDPAFEARLSQRAAELGLGDVLLQIQWQRLGRLQAQPKAWPSLSAWGRLKAQCLRPLFNAAGGTWHPNRSGAWRGFSQTLLYFRAHALRLPLRLLVPHLLHKLKRRWRAHHAPSEARLEG